MDGKIVGTNEVLVLPLIILEPHRFRIDLADAIPKWFQKPVEVPEQEVSGDAHKAVFELDDTNRAIGEHIREALDHLAIHTLDIDLQEIDLPDLVRGTVFGTTLHLHLNLR